MISMNKKLITVSFLLRGERLAPAFVSQTLGVQASKYHTKGETRGGARPASKRYVTKAGLWRAQVESASRTVDDLVGEILQMFEGRKGPLDKIAGVDEAFLDILVLREVSDKTDSTTEFLMRKNQVLRSGQLGLASWITIS